MTRDDSITLPSATSNSFEKDYLAWKINGENDMPAKDARRLVVDLMGATGDSLADRQRERAMEILEDDLGYDWEELREEAARVKQQKLDEREERLGN